VQTQIYLALVRWSGGAFPSIKNFLLMFPKLAKDMVKGDSLDIPFLQCIRVQSVSHEISIPGTKTTVVPQGAAQVESGYDAADYQTLQSLRRSQWRNDRYNRRQRAAAEAQGQQYVDRAISNPPLPPPAPPNPAPANRNEFIKSRLPSHGDITFTKSIDAATPHLSAGCAAQEVYPLGIFFYRRKTGLGVSAIRNPFFVMGVQKAIITSWSISDMTETVTLKYRDIGWCSMESVADTNLPDALKWSTRSYDGDTQSTEKGGFASDLRTLTLLFVAAAGALTAVGSGVHDGVEENT